MNTANHAWTVERMRNLGAALAAILLPGGLLLAVLAWLYRQSRKGDIA